MREVLERIQRAEQEAARLVQEAESEAAARLQAARDEAHELIEEHRRQAHQQAEALLQKAHLAAQEEREARLAQNQSALAAIAQVEPDVRRQAILLIVRAVLSGEVPSAPDASEGKARP